VDDSFTQAAKMAGKAGFLPPEVVNYSIELKNGNDKKVMMAHKVYKKSEDLFDFANTIKRIYSRKQGQ